MSDPHLHFPYTLSDHAEREAIAQRHLAVRAGQPVVPLPTLPMVLRLLAMAAVWHLAPRAGVSHAPRPSTPNGAARAQGRATATAARGRVGKAWQRVAG